MALFREKHWPEAATAFAVVEKKQPGQTDALLYRGKCFFNLGQLSDASEALQSYISVHLQSDNAVYLLAYVRFRENKPKESLQLFTDAAKLKTPTPDDLKIVALDYVLLNDYSDAGHYLEIALQMDPNNIDARYHLGRVRYQENRFADAIAAFQGVLERDPSNLKAENNLGLSLEGINQADQAIATYQKAIALDKSSLPHTEQPYLNLGMLLAKLNRAAEALPLLTQAAQINPNSPQVAYELAKTLFTLNRMEEARRAAEEAVRMRPKDAPTHYLLARIYRSLGKSDAAAQQFKLTEDLINAGNTGGQGMGADSTADRTRK
jgi:tetratricopeptide (TPR) repeat protein